MERSQLERRLTRYIERWGLAEYTAFALACAISEDHYTEDLASIDATDAACACVYFLTMTPGRVTRKRAQDLILLFIERANRVGLCRLYMLKGERTAYLENARYAMRKYQKGAA